MRTKNTLRIGFPELTTRGQLPGNTRVHHGHKAQIAITLNTTIPQIKAKVTKKWSMP
jgi:hypothetical protein